MNKDKLKVVATMAGLLIIAFFFMFVTNHLLTMYSEEHWDDDWQAIKDSEEQHIFSGRLVSVDYVDPGPNMDYTLIVLGRNSYYFKDWDYAELKGFEGREVEILCYSTMYDGYYSLSCADWERFNDGYIREV